jgi:hypothetical protein
MSQIDVHKTPSPDRGGQDPDGLERSDASADGVEAGAVFLARNRQQRRVWAVRDGRVHFFVRPPGGGAFWSPGHPPHLAPTVALFLAEVTGRLSAGRNRRSAERDPPVQTRRGPDRPTPSHKNAYR